MVRSYILLYSVELDILYAWQGRLEFEASHRVSMFETAGTYIPFPYP